MASKDVPLPKDLETCQRELARVLAELAHLQSVLSETSGVCEEQRSEIEKLKSELELIRLCMFGRRSERHVDGEGQGHLFDLAGNGEKAPANPAILEEIKYTRRRRGHGWGPLPERLPREEVLLEVPESERVCTDCGQPMARIGEDVSERVDFRPARVFIKRIVRPKYACPKKHGGVTQVASPPAPVRGGRFDFGYTAQVLTSKFADHLPLYRQQDVLARAGLEPSRSTLCDIVADSARLLLPLAFLLRYRLLASDLLGADDTPVRVLDRGHPQGSFTARLWLYRGYHAAPYNVFDYHHSRERDGPAEFLESFEGWVKVDAYGVQDGVYLASGGRIRASCCMAHARRKFVEAKSSHPALSAEALAFIRQLYDIEDRARPLTPEARRQMRQQEAAPVLDRLREWLDHQARGALPKLRFGEAVGYMRNQWTGLINYLEDGRVPLDNNDTERDLRALTIGRKNWLFLGSPEAGPRAATIYTVVASAARHCLDVWAYLRDVMERLAVGETDLMALLPDTWAQSHPEAIRTYRQHEQETRATAKRERRQRRRLLEQARAHRA